MSNDEELRRSLAVVQRKAAFMDLKDKLALLEAILRSETAKTLSALSAKALDKVIQARFIGLMKLPPEQLEKMTEAQRLGIPWVGEYPKAPPEKPSTDYAPGDIVKLNDGNTGGPIQYKPPSTTNPSMALDWVNFLSADPPQPFSNSINPAGESK